MGKGPMSPALRRSGRIHVRAPVTISGKFLDGKPFTEDTHILTVSKYGAKLKSQLPLKVGMQIRVQPKLRQQTALFRVVWTGREDSARAGEAGIEYVEVSNLLGVSFPG